MPLLHGTFKKHQTGLHARLLAFFYPFFGRPVAQSHGVFKHFVRSPTAAYPIGPRRCHVLFACVCVCVRFSATKKSFMYSRWRLVAFNLEGVLARACALPELVHVPAEAVASLDSLSKEVICAFSWVRGFRRPCPRAFSVTLCSKRLRIVGASLRFAHVEVFEIRMRSTPCLRR